MTVVVTHTTPADSTFSSTGAAAWNADHALSGVGTMAEQNANNVAITGGTINNTTIGATTPSTGVFTTLTAQNETLKGTGQNLLLQSQTFQNFIWVKQTNVTATDNVTTAPDGSSTAASIAWGSASNGVGIYQAKTGLQLNGTTANTKSIYVRADVGGGTVILTDPAITVGTTTVTLTTSWQRVTLTDTGQTTAAGIWLQKTASSPSTIYVWGGQLELGSVANTYIPTTTTAVYGTPTLSFSGVASIGLQSDGSLYETSAGTGNVRFYTNNIGQEQARVSHTASAVNYVQVTGGATTKGVIQSAQGSDSNISYVTQSKGTGAIDLAAGSSGVNISNGGTVTAITRTAQGSNYTSAPSVSISAPTTAGGVQATVSAYLRIFGETLTSGGTGYTVNDIITFVGGTGISTASYRVTSVSVGVITGISLNTAGGYTTVPSNPISVTGGTGTGATITVTNWGVANITVATAGSGYVEQPTVTFSGGGGSGAAAYATVGSAVILKSIGGTLDLSTTNGIGLRIYDSGGTVPSSGYWAASSGTSSPFLWARGGTNTAGLITSSGTGAISIQTNSGSQTQFVAAHTASAVNYVQVTGAATSGTPVISVQGSDTNITAFYQTKGVGSHIFGTRGSTQQFRISDTGSAVNYLQATGSITGFGPVLSAQGSDTNIPAVVQPKGTGALQAQQTDSTATGGNARGANAVDWQTARGTAGQVASGQLSFIGGGTNNTASQYNATVVGGFGNTVSNVASFVGSGSTNTASGQYGGIVTGIANTTAGYLNFIGGGFTNSGTSGSAVTTQSATMNATTAVTLSGSNANIKVGQYIVGTSIGADTYVAAISGTSLTLSKVASGSSTSTLSFFTPHGVVVGGGNNQATGSYSFIGGGGDAGTAANRNVASGDWSFVGGGRKNTASGAGSVIVGGGWDGSNNFSNTASGAMSFIGCGYNNIASGYGSFVASGASNSASNVYTVIGGGNSNSANAYGSTVVGGQFGTTRSVSGNIIFPACNVPLGATQGASQAALLVLAVQTTDATATVLRSDASAASTTNQVILPNNSAYFFTGEIISGVTGGGNSKGWTIEGVIKRGANAASTTLVGSTVTSLYADAGAATWAIALSADTTNGGLAVTFTGQAATTIRTVCQIRTTEMTY
jgi:hypothetical protein